MRHRITHCLLAISVYILGLSPSASAQSSDIAIDAVYSCRVSGAVQTLLKKGAPLAKAAAAKETKKLKATLATLKTALAAAKRTGKAKAITKAKARLDVTKATQSKVKACIAGTFIPEVVSTPVPTATPTVTPTPTLTPTITPTAGAAFPLSMRNGTYTGTWNNTTFSSSGAITITLSVTGNVGFSLNMDLDGNVFGNGNPPSEKFEGSFTGSPPNMFTYTSPLFGSNTVITVTGSGDFQLDAPNPTASISNYSLTIDFDDSNNTATGVWSLKLMGMNVNGTATLVKTQ